MSGYRPITLTCLLMAQKLFAATREKALFLDRRRHFVEGLEHRVSNVIHQAMHYRFIHFTKFAPLVACERPRIVCFF